MASDVVEATDSLDDAAGNGGWAALKALGEDELLTEILYPIEVMALPEIARTQVRYSRGRRWLDGWAANVEQHRTYRWSKWTHQTTFSTSKAAFLGPRAISFALLMLLWALDFLKSLQGQLLMETFHLRRYLWMSVIRTHTNP